MFFYNKERHLAEYLQGLNRISHFCVPEEVSQRKIEARKETLWRITASAFWHQLIYLIAYLNFADYPKSEVV